MIYSVIDVNSQGDEEVFVYCKNYKIAELNLIIVKGLDQDSFNHPMAKIKKVEGFIGDLKVLRTKVRKVKKQNG